MYRLPLPVTSSVLRVENDAYCVRMLCLSIAQSADLDMSGRGKLTHFLATDHLDGIVGLTSCAHNKKSATRMEKENTARTQSSDGP